MDFLTEILEAKKQEIAELKRKYSFSSFSNFKFWKAPTINFRQQIIDDKEIKLIAEIKKASPSKGVLLNDFNHLQIAEDYMLGGADAISILTDKLFFKGNISFLNDVAQVKTIPLLRKDFIIDEYQIFEAKANGADIILLIAEALSETQIKDLINTSEELGLSVLLEMHNENQLPKISFDKIFILGINNRDLLTFNVDLNTTISIKEKLPANLPVISESGILCKADIKLLQNSKVNGFLIGEFLMKANNRIEKLKELKRWCENES